MNRRGFLAGLMATAAAGVVTRALPVYALRTTVAAGEVYGRSPAVMALPSLAELQRYEMTWREHWSELAETLMPGRVGLSAPDGEIAA